MERNYTQVRLSDYDWTQALKANLARDTNTQGERYKMLHQLYEAALAGRPVQVENPPTIQTPDGDSVRHIIMGYGRIKSLLRWNELSPAERAAEALAWAFPRNLSGGKGKAENKMVTQAQLDALATADGDLRGALKKITALNPQETGVDYGTLVAGFEADLSTVPMELLDVDDETAVEMARKDVLTQRATMADQLSIMERMLDQARAEQRPFDVAGAAELFGVSDVQVGYMRAYAVARKLGGIDPAFDVFTKTNLASTPERRRVEKGKVNPAPAGFEKLRTVIGWTGKAKDETTGVEIGPGLQRRALQRMVDDWAASVKQSAPDLGAVEPDDAARKRGASAMPPKQCQLSDEQLTELFTRVPGKGFIDALASIKDEEHLKYLELTDPEAFEREQAKREAADADPSAVLPSAPTMADLRNLFDLKRIKENEHPYGELFALFAKLLRGHVTPKAFVMDSIDINKPKGRKAKQVSDHWDTLPGRAEDGGRAAIPPYGKAKPADTDTDGDGADEADDA